MIAICKKCNVHCISWASNKQACNCGNINGFKIEDDCLSPQSVDESNISIWYPELQKYMPYDKEYFYDNEFWCGCKTKFAI